MCPPHVYLTGSPPQVRGKPVIIDELQLSDGITPAGAGKTAFQAVRKFLIKDHPRRCGENFVLPFHASVSQGSPPQVRGKHVIIPNLGTANRITPAGAGKTRSLRFSMRRSRDHPRRCGENDCQGLLDAWLTGITPAGAGKTLILLSVIIYW